MGAEAFVVIREAMRDKERVALAKIVIAHREHIIALEPLDKGILGTTLRYDHEVRDEDEYFSGLTWPRVNKEMVDLASHILATKETKFDPRKFKDDYETALRSSSAARPRARPSRRPRKPKAGQCDRSRRGAAAELGVATPSRPPESLRRNRAGRARPPEPTERRGQRGT